MKKRKKQKRRNFRKEKKKNSPVKEMTGRFSRTRDGFGFVIDSEGKRPDVFVPVGSTEGAVTGDIVTVAIGKRGGKGPRGRIVRIDEKRASGFLATIREYGGTLYAVPDDPAAGEEVYIRNQDSASADHRVLIEIDRESLNSGMVKGKVLDDFGHCEDPAVDLASIMKLNGYTETYPKGCVAEAEQAASKAIDLEDREDYRELFTCTVDPASAKDFDDAISVRKHDEGWDVWVHIADVSHYVPGGENLDREALNRSTSVYLLDRVVPMLPECLSNETCSLSEGDERAVKTVCMTISHEGRIIDYRIERGVIVSDRRFTYGEVQDIIEGNSHNELSGYVLEMHKAASALRKRRFREGSVNLEIPEMLPVIDDNGEVLELEMKTQKESNQMIEDFMLAANTCVADILLKKRLSGPYRVHEEPDPVKKKELCKYLLNFGITLKPDFSRRELMKVINRISGETDAYIVNLAILRSFKQAEYSTANTGHFALAFGKYLHFTSPIRRYPDLAVHRSIDKTLFGLDTGNGPETKSLEVQSSMVRTCNENERKAMQAENTLSTTKILRYIKNLPEGTVLEGVISRVDEYYLAVELTDYLVYGRLYLSDIKGQFRSTKKGVTVSDGNNSVKLRIGTAVRVVCSEIDPFRRTIELFLADNPE